MGRRQNSKTQMPGVRPLLAGMKREALLRDIPLRDVSAVVKLRQAGVRKKGHGPLCLTR
jgi:hypothetical protein